MRQTFLGFMNGKAPGTILTDQNMWLKEAVADQIPKTKHAFCIRHIVAKFSDWFSVLLGPRYDKWKTDFHELYNLHSVEDFEGEWSKMVSMYGLHGNKHINSLYALRMFWALPYLRSYFCAGMTNAIQSEAVSAYIQRILSAQSNLENLVEQVAAIVELKDEAGAKQKLQRKIRKVTLKTGSPIESHAASILTPYAFTKLQEELVSAPQFASLMVDENYFIVRHHTQLNGGYKVIWIPQDEFISCSCCQFEFSGILCRHILRVLSNNNCFHIPDRYLPLRWCGAKSSMRTSGEYAGKVQLLRSMVASLISEPFESEEFLDVACDQIGAALSRIKEFSGNPHETDEIGYNSPPESLILPEVEESVHGFAVGNPHESIPTGKMKERRTRDGMDLYRKRRRCSVPCCGLLGHDTAECPMMQGDDLNGDGLGFL